MKYEPVFGDQALLEDAGTFTGLDVFTRNVDTGLYGYCRHEDLTYDYLRKNPVLAMRRIIPEPKRWTWEDQMAGRLPEVGAIIVSDGFNEKCEFLGVGMVNGFFVVRLPNGLISINSASSFKPPETPEEKAARLKDEWGARATELFMRSDNDAAFDFIYDALLSGELPMPSKGGEL